LAEQTFTHFMIHVPPPLIASLNKLTLHTMSQKWLLLNVSKNFFKTSQLER